MTEKRFTIKPLMFKEEIRNGIFEQGSDEKLSNREVVSILNEQNETITKLKSICKDHKDYANDVEADFVRLEQKVKETLRNHYLECKKWSDSHTMLIIKQIGIDLGVDLE